MARPRATLRRAVRIGVELLVMIVLLLVIDRLWGGQDGFVGFQPNPYWLPVLVMAVTYGSWAGLAAAGAATLAWLATNGVDANRGDYFDYMFAISLPPLLWYTAAVILGEATDSRKRSIRRLTMGKQVAKRNMDRLIDAFHKLAQNNRVLQLRIATEDRTVSEALALAARLPHATGLERQGILRAMVTMACHSDNFTCYRLQSGRAWPVLFGDGCHQQQRPLPDALSAALRERRTIIHAAIPADRPLLSDVGLLAIPLVARGEEPRLEGVLILHHLPFATLGPHLNADMAALAGWLVSHVSDNSLLGDLAPLREQSV
ncbi:hypothetical protein LWE61_07030 [Sphingobium sufflavum]|uniref:hypothetical protein n=1 Tax=Sphingobium sufflavum TaxID=1129547 RepID=UPI001F4051DE|nr:hypothetical protein [Sphingobium sufflavum]MCE7796315.1 hypothetical protein [Sphingobium sufflavum]